MIARQNRPPNVLLVVVDCLRADHCSLFGYHRDTTPTLERLATSGVAYEQAISPASWSLPAHASLFTGLFPSKHGVHDEQQYLDRDIPVLAEELQRAGYATVGFCGNPWVNQATGLNRGFETYDELRIRDAGTKGQLTRAKRKLQKLVTGHATRRADLTTERATKTLRELSKTAKPFFMFIHYNEPHTPRHLPRPAAERYLAPYSWADAKPLSRDVNGYIAGAVHWSERDLSVFSALYDAAVRYVDDRLAQLIETLRETETLDNTLVIVTADHGENLGDHGLLGHKLCLYDTLIHVPLVLRYPGSFSDGTRVTDQVQTVDIAPTVRELTGLENRWRGDPGAGRSLLGQRSRHEPAFAEQFRPDLSVFTKKYPAFDPVPFDRRLRTIRIGEWKYIWSSDGRHELYRLAADASEGQNLILDEPDVAERLRQQLTGWVDSIVPASTSHTEVEFDPVVTERLRALGYIP